MSPNRPGEHDRWIFSRLLSRWMLWPGQDWTGRMSATTRDGAALAGGGGGAIKQSCNRAAAKTLSDRLTLSQAGRRRQSSLPRTLLSQFRSGRTANQPMRPPLRRLRHRKLQAFLVRSGSSSLVLLVNWKRRRRAAYAGDGGRQRHSCILGFRRSLTSFPSPLATRIRRGRGLGQSAVALFHGRRSGPHRRKSRG